MRQSHGPGNALSGKILYRVDRGGRCLGHIPCHHRMALRRPAALPLQPGGMRPGLRAQGEPAWDQGHHVGEFSLHPHRREPDDLERDSGAGMRRHAGAVCLESQEPGKTHPPALQRWQHGHCGYRLLRVLRAPSDQEYSQYSTGGVVGVFLYEHGARRRGGVLDGEQAAGANLARLLLLDLSFLRGGSFHRLAAVPGEPEL